MICTCLFASLCLVFVSSNSIAGYVCRQGSAMGSSAVDLALHKSVLKREAWKEREFSQAQAQRDAEFLATVGTTEMTVESLKNIIKSDKRMYFNSVELNDKLYIHYKGWRTLQHLDGWTGLRALYAECNAFDHISGLQHCCQLRCLFLQENCISHISGLENCANLWSLNLSNNFITRISGLAHLKGLNSLMIAKNKIGHGGVDDIAELANMNISSLDLQGNAISDPDVVPEVFMRMADLRVLYLKDNPCTKKIINYRKSTIVYCKNLRYLDDRPVFEDDRRTAEAFNMSGLEGERNERKHIRDEANEKHRRNMEAFSEMIKHAKLEKREKDAMRAEDKYTDDTDPVDSYERRMKHLYSRWEDEHKDELRDDAKDYATVCLESERARSDRQSQVKGQDRHPNADHNAVSLNEEVAHVKESSEKLKVDTRTLVYEDLWDDVPLRSRADDSSEMVTFVESANVELSRAQQQGEWMTGAGSSFPVQTSWPREGAVHETSTPSWYSEFREKDLDQTQVVSKPSAELTAMSMDVYREVEDASQASSGQIRSSSQRVGAKSETPARPAFAFRPPARVPAELNEMD